MPVFWRTVLRGLVTAAAMSGGMTVSELTMAWGVVGHQVVARLAEAELSSAAKTGVVSLLALERGATLVSISTWADEHRDEAPGSWHYVNFPRGDCRYVPERDCPGGHCVVAAADAQLRVLASDAPAEMRLRALKYVVHLVADVHQPLHAGWGDDRGGNSYQLQAFGEGTNLHAFWDAGFFRQLNESAESMATRLRSMPSPLLTAPPLSMAKAAEESCQHVAGEGFYPIGRQVNLAYLETYTPLVEQRLLLAGARLAGYLNEVFTDKHPTMGFKPPPR